MTAAKIAYLRGLAELRGDVDIMILCDHASDAFRNGFNAGMSRAADILRDAHPDAVVTLARAVVEGKADAPGGA